MTSSARSTIDRLATITKKNDNEHELRRFLSTEEVFRCDQYDYGLSLLHYVAGREFGSAEEADDWLGYAIVQKNQDVEKESFLSALRPLHCACEWGNIFGVQWLVTHGANINAKDDREHTPYSYACRSSADTMKKMVYLEEHGCISQSFDILWAAANPFSSSEKANEILHYLVNEKGLSVNAIEEEDGNTPLHCACEVGSIFEVTWLIEHHADISGVNEGGTTPLMYACQSHINRSAKVRYLAEKGADCQAKDHDGKTALFYATAPTPSECEDDVKDVLRYLVIEKGIHINSVYKKGRTPLLYACNHYPSFVVIQQIIELEADVSLRDKNEQNALHKVAQNYLSVDKSIIYLLIERGCDVTHQDKDGKTPYEVAINDEIRAHLRQH
ncbi:putative ankyrin repeat protein RF_0381 [Oscarella lobularis]|uniref:putative ankyrin repeat protein RF_0381 n=1 Tax=Oscarella lobularis TaxID=121494 RepID=UPI00331363F8